MVWARQHTIDYLIIPDSDEVLSRELLATLKKIAEAELAGCPLTWPG